MENLKKQAMDKIFREMEKLEKRKTPSEKDWFCGSCTGDPAYADNYYSEMAETETYRAIWNSCQDSFFAGGEKVMFFELTAGELTSLLIHVRAEVAKKKKEEAEERKNLQAVLQAGLE